MSESTISGPTPLPEEIQTHPYTPITGRQLTFVQRGENLYGKTHHFQHFAQRILHSFSLHQHGSNRHAKAPEATKPPETKHSIYSQAPMLDELVQAGKIPPVEERLPGQPFVVGPGVYLTRENLPDWTPGEYGGTLRSVQNEADWNADVFVAIDEPFLMAPKISDQGIICNVCQEYKVSDDNKIFTFTLRKGLKWSDGEPVTTEDVRFAWEEVQNNTVVYPDGPDTVFRTGYSPDGNLARFDFPDDYTFTITFDAPYGGFLRALAIEGWVGYTILLEPAHYLKLAKYDLASTRCTYWDMTALRCVRISSAQSLDRCCDE